MSRHSQNFYSHHIEKAANPSKMYFPIAFKCVNQCYKRSTILLGNSNTRRYKVGEGIETFGCGIPGKCKDAMLIKHINPVDCMSYSNVVIQCGINNITSSKSTINGPRDVKVIFDKFKNKVAQVMSACLAINVYIVPILPTRSVTYNRAVRVFNGMIQSQIIDTYYHCMSINVEELAFSDTAVCVPSLCLQTGMTSILILRGSGKMHIIFEILFF